MVTLFITGLIAVVDGRHGNYPSLPCSMGVDAVMVMDRSARAIPGASTRSESPTRPETRRTLAVQWSSPALTRHGGTVRSPRGQGSWWPRKLAFEVES